MSRKYFGTDGIRGPANGANMTPEIAMRVGMATGIVLATREGSQRIVIGKDTRLSGYMLETALCAGFTAVGADVFMLGPIPTPAVAMLTRSLRADIGVVISASHNGYADNGIKIFGSDGFKLSDSVEAEIEALMDSDMSPQLSRNGDIGRATRLDGVRDRYVEFAKRTFPRARSLDGLRVVVDCANGAAYRVAPDVFWELGAEVISIGVTPNGTNINRDCGSTSLDTIRAKVREVRADVGVALDGDADRVIIIDEKGDVVDGDQLLAVIARSWQQSDRLEQNTVVTTIMSNLGLQRYFDGCGITMERTKVGDRYVAERMREGGFNIGGEQSGHIILSDYTTTGDGILAALELMAVVVESGRRVSEVCHRFERVPQILKNVRFNGGKPLEAEPVIDAIDAAKARLGGGGRIVIRPSGTEPLIRIMAEGDDAALIHTLVDELCTVVGAHG
ncbi:phosphoglucosamine mutase [Acuticoccus sp. I52.16.1]|uniref:phosphoglucosamine mutase n=1 Tax=Acuticoccus sp. I52.16.1 TaxID=2928472 RepID=UPI001FD357B7|nr:phosphoglucosamine mutase [Acuticoccus sp. I52.16.1]UOM36332.1 phosphoglucosamine mutase [Acuticoccus sp. I52.16.1]